MAQGMHGRGACMAGGGGMCSREGGMHTGERATEADVTHPTGMHSCVKYITSTYYQPSHLLLRKLLIQYNKQCLRTGINKIHTGGMVHVSTTEL